MHGGSACENRSDSIDQAIFGLFALLRTDSNFLRVIITLKLDTGRINNPREMHGWLATLCSIDCFAMWIIIEIVLIL